MANIGFLRRKAYSKLLKLRPLIGVQQLTFSRSRSFSNSPTEKTESKENEFLDEYSLADAEEEIHLQQLQDVSGLPPKYYQQYHGMVTEPPFKNLQRRRKMFMTYGSKSGEDPRLLWPSRQEITEKQKEDGEEEIPLSEKIQLMRQEKEETLKFKTERYKMIEKNMSQMNKWISEYYKKVDAAEVEIQKKKEKKEALLDEARDYFGYRIKANDPKFQQMMEEKEERERKEAKELKKKEKARKAAERLKQDVMAMKLGSSEQSKGGVQSS